MLPSAALAKERTHTHTHTTIHTNKHTHKHTCVQIVMLPSAPLAKERTHTHTHNHTHKHTHTHTNTHVRRLSCCLQQLLLKREPMQKRAHLRLAGVCACVYFCVRCVWVRVCVCVCVCVCVMVHTCSDRRSARTCGLQVCVCL